MSPLLQYHGKVEEAIRASVVPYTILRPLFLTQSFYPDVLKVIAAKATLFPVREQKMLFAHLSRITKQTQIPKGT